jgi:uncharacterized transporter YbjL
VKGFMRFFAPLLECALFGETVLCERGVTLHIILCYLGCSLLVFILAMGVCVSPKYSTSLRQHG